MRTTLTMVAEIRSLDESGADRVIARVWLEQDEAKCDNPELLSEWQEDGIVGGSPPQRYFPRDGQQFVAALPFQYRSGHVRARLLGHTANEPSFRFEPF